MEKMFACKMNQLAKVDALKVELLKTQIEQFGNKFTILTGPLVPIKNEGIPPMIMEDPSELHKLVEMLHDGYNFSLYNFEPNYLNKFSSKQIDLGEKVNVKQTLEMAMKLHQKYREAICKKSLDREVICYRYIYKNEYRFIKFHNDMDFHDDILVLFYLHAATTPLAFTTKTVQQTLQMLHRKYKIQNGWGPHFFTEIKLGEEEQILSIYKLLCAFPSITISLFHHNLSSLAKLSDILFLEFKSLPKAIFHHMISTVLPCTVKPAPTALIMYLSQKYLYCTSKNDDLSFQTFFECIRKLYRNSVFPEEMKIQLCIYWNIVEQHDGKLFFNPAIMNANERAKYLLTSTMEEEQINLIVNM